MTSLRVRAPAKVNWTLEVLSKRRDGYHEVRTVLQTIDLCDIVTLRPADSISLTLTGSTGSLASGPVERNLAYRAAIRLQRELAGRERGAHTELEKRIPVAAGLGGGSSDAAAVLRGLRELWEIDISAEDLASIAAELGSDVPFFLRGGTAIASGRGEQVKPLAEPPEQRLVIAWPAVEASPDKTARMYAALRSAHYSDGSRTEQLAKRIPRGELVRDDDVENVFERVLGDVDAEAARWFQRASALGTPHLCGSGPAIFFLLQSFGAAEALVSDLRRLGLNAAAVDTLSSVEAIRVSRSA